MSITLIVVISLGFVTAVINCLIRKFSWKREPELAAFLEIMVSSIGIWIGIKVTKMALLLPSELATEEDKLYFCLGALAVIWGALATIWRKFQRPQ